MQTTTVLNDTKEETVWLNIRDYGRQCREKGSASTASNGQLNRLRKNLYISTHTVETLCRILDCRVEDVMEIVFDENEEPLWSPGLEEERQKEKELERKKNRQG